MLALQHMEYKMSHKWNVHALSSTLSSSELLCSTTVYHSWAIEFRQPNLNMYGTDRPVTSKVCGQYRLLHWPLTSKVMWCRLLQWHISNISYSRRLRPPWTHWWSRAVSRKEGGAQWKVLVRCIKSTGTIIGQYTVVEKKKIELSLAEPLTAGVIQHTEQVGTSSISEIAQGLWRGANRMCNGGLGWPASAG